jgi:hypothetical protein
MTPVARKYLPLGAYLSALGNREITFTFAHIAQIIGSELPPSATTLGSSWWSNQPGHSQADAWLNAGWRVTRVSQARPNRDVHPNA